LRPLRLFTSRLFLLYLYACFASLLRFFRLLRICIYLDFASRLSCFFPSRLPLTLPLPLVCFFVLFFALVSRPCLASFVCPLLPLFALVFDSLFGVCFVILFTSASRPSLSLSALAFSFALRLFYLYLAPSFCLCVFLLPFSRFLSAFASAPFLSFSVRFASVFSNAFAFRVYLYPIS
jgi:hypothetical protein